MTARLIIGDSLTVLRTLPDASVDLVLTSPPFLALRSYLPSDHPDKHLEMGSEATPGEFIDALLDIVEECRRILAPHGSICFELGDTYGGSGGAGGDYSGDGLRAGQPTFDGSTKHRRHAGRTQWEADHPITLDHTHTVPTKGDGWPLDKSLTLIPESFRWALVYGRNPFTGRPTPRWRARNVIRWCRPNPPVGALGDKVRPATSDMVIACVGRRRYFDLDAVRQPGSPNTHQRIAKGIEVLPRKGKSADRGGTGSWDSLPERNSDTEAGAPPLDHWWADDDRFDQDAWNIPTAPYPGAHYATFPERLVVRPILAMCPQRVCVFCGRPSERITETEYVRTRGAGEPNLSNGHHGPEGVNRRKGGIGDNSVTALNTTVGWTDCGHDSWRPGVTLDPFAGSGTTLAVAVGHGRDALGIDLDGRNAALARERCGMFLTVEHHGQDSLDDWEPRPMVDVPAPLLGPEAA